MRRVKFLGYINKEEKHASKQPVLSKLDLEQDQGCINNLGTQLNIYLNAAGQLSLYSKKCLEARYRPSKREDGIK